MGLRNHLSAVVVFLCRESVMDGAVNLWSILCVELVLVGLYRTGV